MEIPREQTPCDNLTLAHPAHDTISNSDTTLSRRDLVVNGSNFALRMFGCLLNIGLFVWFTYRLPVFVRPRLASTA